jgi:ribosomal protein L11 methyltransferase
MSSPENRTAWLELAVEVAGIDAEIAADVLRQACPGGAAIQSSTRFDPASDAYVVDGDATAVVRGYLPDGADASRIRDSVRLALNMAPLQAKPRWKRFRKLMERDWQESWKKHFGVQRIGQALVIKPSWTHYRLNGGEILLEIDPGMAFGTGQHPTTAMCLRALEEFVRPRMRVLDLGCGSGILGIAAAKLGASRVLALDVDPHAVRAARENAEANGVTSALEVREGTLDASRRNQSAVKADEPFDIIVANISGLTLERLAPSLANALTNGGLLTTSGFLEDAVSGLTSANETAGLTIERVIHDGVWRAIIARAPE